MAISHAGKCDRAMTEVDALVGPGLDLVEVLRIGVTPNYELVRNFSTPSCSENSDILTSLVVRPMAR